MYKLLTNRVYLGEAVHKGQSCPGEHAAIVPRDVWDRVHDVLRESPRSHAARSRAQTPALLRGLLFGPDGRTLSPTRGDPALVKALARAFRWKRMMDDGRYGSINQLAAAEKINESYVSRVLRLILLAPEIVEVILDGRQSAEVRLPVLMKVFPVWWSGAHHASTANFSNSASSSLSRR